MTGDSMDELLATIRAKAAQRGNLFGPPLAEADIRAFEIRHRIELPEGYRRFLAVVGNGGVGPPAYRLMRLGEIPNHMCPEFERDWRELPHITEPFPHTATWVWEDEEYNQTRQDAARHGTLNLGHDGCGLYWLLVVTGTQRGQVWALADVGVCPQSPGRDFLQWIEAWLDHVPFWA